MRALIVLFAMVVTGCGGGVNCSDKHPGPGCWEADQKRQRADRADQARECKQLGFAAGDAAKALGCDDAVHHCESSDAGTFGCPADWRCGVDDPRLCYPKDADAFAPPNKVPTYCARCADRKLMGEQRARATAAAAEHTARIASERTISDGEVKANLCTPARQAALTKALGEVERAKQKYAFASKQRGQVVATAEGVPLDFTIGDDGSFWLVAVSILELELSSSTVRSGGPDAYPQVGKLYTATDASLMQKDGLQQRWLVKGHGCAMWSLLFRK